MATNINRQRVLSRKISAINDGVGGGAIIPFDPASDTDGHLALWLRARAADLNMNATLPFIDKWDDNSSGLSIQYNSGTGLGTSTHPTWDGTVGDEWVMFDGGDFMNSPTTINLNTSVDNGWAIALTVKMDDWALTNVVVGDDSSNNGMLKFVSNTGVHTKLWNPTLSTASTKGVTIDTPAALVDTEAYVFIWTMDPTTNHATLWIDGVAQTSTFNFPMGYDFHQLDEIGAKNGGSLGMTGGIKEYMVFEGTLSLTDIANLNTYMYNKI
tara:strand:+ start:1918 stop:2724 length:807 start_codon:yes stop_codon:yes gene_type:complete